MGAGLAQAGKSHPAGYDARQPRVPVHFDGTGPRSRCQVVGPDTASIGSVRVREPFTISTLDASGNQLRPSVDADSVDLTRTFPVTGPIDIEGVSEGDVVAIEILDPRLAPEAHCWTRPGLGLLGTDDYFVKQLETDAPTWRFAGRPASGVPISLDPHVGTVGLSPARTHAARDLGRHGGNLDVRALGSGATLWLVAQVDGGRLYLGDVHAGIGDGEVCGTGLEAAANVTVQVHRRTDWTPTLLTISTSSRRWVVGVGESVEQAIATIVSAMTSIISSALAISVDEARLLVSQSLILRICAVGKRAGAGDGCRTGPTCMVMRSSSLSRRYGVAVRPSQRRTGICRTPRPAGAWRFGLSGARSRNCTGPAQCCGSARGASRRR